MPGVRASPRDGSEVPGKALEWNVKELDWQCKQQRSDDECHAELILSTSVVFVAASSDDVPVTRHSGERGYRDVFFGLVSELIFSTTAFYNATS
jgi:hypothetical protein